MPSLSRPRPYARALARPTPGPRTRSICGVLAEHNPLEEGPGGVHAVCEQLAGPEVDALLARLASTPEVPLARHFDGPRGASASRPSCKRGAPRRAPDLRHPAR